MKRHSSSENLRGIQQHRRCIRYRLYTLIILLSCPFAPAARVLFYQMENGNPDTEARLNLSCRFYGIELKKTTPPRPLTAQASGPAAVVIDAACLDKVQPSDLPEKTLAILITGIDETTSMSQIKDWTGYTVEAKQIGVPASSNCYFQVSDKVPALTHELTGQQLSVDMAKGVLLQAPDLSTIISYGSSPQFFVWNQQKNLPVYLLADLSVTRPADAAIWFSDHGFFIEIAPYLIFIKQAFGEYAWHADGSYANLTIDDPWLRDIYGPLRYSDHLQQMDSANFHTAIAFIPWNHDRSFSPRVVNLFSQRPDRFSLSMHGNNHDHHEFNEYEKTAGAAWPAKPLPEQEADIRQGLARMNAFQKATGLSCDPVMIFPHSIAPAATLTLLKKYNFLITVNAGHIPLGTQPPTDPLFWLRTAGSFGGMASLNREGSNRRTSADIAIELFLDNPVLFVEHLLYFRHSASAFNRTAELVNRIQPDVKWVSLGTIARHLYLVKKQNDGTYAVRMLSPEINLKNSGSALRTYHIEKSDPGDIPIEQVLVDGKPAIYSQTSGIHLTLIVPPGTEKKIQIIYKNGFDPELEDLSKKNRHINALRRLSEIRDRFLSTGIIGYAIDRIYYSTNFYKLGIKGLGGLALAGLLILCWIFALIKKRRGKRK